MTAPGEKLLSVRDLSVAFGHGAREVLAIDVSTAESLEHWREFLQGLVARGVRGVRLVTSDAHAGLKRAIAEVFLADRAGGSLILRSRTPEREDFDEIPVFARAGAWGQANQAFGGKLAEFLLQLNEAMAA